MTYTVSLKQGPHGQLIVITDTDILNKLFEEGNRQLDLTSKFYQGEEKTKEEVKQLINNAKDLHATGKASVAILIEMDIVKPDTILWVQKIPHVQVTNPN